MPQLVPLTQAQIDAIDIRERGVREGSTSPEENFEIDQSGTRRTFRVRWPQRKTFIAWMLGQSTLFVDSGVTRLSRIMPQAHPDYADLVATKINRVVGHKFVGRAVAPVDPAFVSDPSRNFGHPDYEFSAQQLNVYQDAEIEVQYEHADYERLDDTATYASDGGEYNRYVTRGETTPDAQALQLPGAVMQYVVEIGTAPPHEISVPFNNVRVLPQEKFSLTWRRLPEDAWDTDSNLYQRVYVGDTVGGELVPYIGTVNRAEFYGRAPGTVLFENVRPMLKRSPLGQGFEWDLEFNFNWNPNGWLNAYYFATSSSGAENGFYFIRNKRADDFYRPDELLDDTGLYNTRDHNKLFSVAA